MLQKKNYKVYFFVLASILIINIFPTKRVYADSVDFNDNYLYEDLSNEDIETFYDKDGYFIVRIKYNSINKQSSSPGINSVSNRSKYFSVPKWKSWKTRMTINNNIAANALNLAMTSGLTGSLDNVFNLFKYVPKEVIVGSISIFSPDIGGESMVKIWDKNKNGKLEWQVREKSDIYGNIAQVEWRVI